jgi:hypothetical protein
MEEKNFELFEKPPLETKIWRYMDFSTFVSVLSNSALHFKRMDLLDDEFEGTLPKTRRKKTSNIKALCRDLNLDYKKELRELRSAQKTISVVHSKIVKANRKMRFVNSWTMDETESVAMWRLYVKSPDGVAFQSTFKRLSNSFVNKHDVNLGIVHYVDFNRQENDAFDEVASWHRGFPFMFKRPCFAYEKELRVVILTEPVTEKAKKQYWWKNGIRGMPEVQYQQVNLAILVEKIHVSPTSGQWFYDLVNSVVKKYGFSLPVASSSIADNPTY